MSGDLVTELIELVNAYHWRWVVVHGDHGLDCQLCAGLHERHAWALAALEHEPDEPEAGRGVSDTALATLLIVAALLTLALLGWFGPPKMRCVNHDRCGNHVDFGHPMTYWEATVAVRDRDGGGPNRRSLKRTGRGWCVPCSIRIEHRLSGDEYPQETLIDA